MRQKRMPGVLWAVGARLILALCFANPLYGQVAASGGAGEVLLQDDFNDGDLGGWQTVGGNWSVEPGDFGGLVLMVRNSNPYAHVVTGAPDFANIQIKGILGHVGDATGKRRILFRIQDIDAGENVGHYYAFEYETTGLNPTTARFLRVDGTSVHVLAERRELGSLEGGDTYPVLTRPAVAGSNLPGDNLRLNRWYHSRSRPVKLTKSVASTLPSITIAVASDARQYRLTIQLGVNEPINKVRHRSSCPEHWPDQAARCNRSHRREWARLVGRA